MSASHTPTPYEVMHDGVFKNDVCIAVCDTDVFSKKRDAANAAFIVRACNAHDGLLAELRQAHTELTVAGNLLGNSGLRGMASIYQAAADRVAAALAKAEAAR